MAENLSETINDLNSLARFMRGASRAAELLADVDAIDRLTGEANVRLKTAEDAVAKAQADLDNIEGARSKAQADLDALEMRKPKLLEEIDNVYKSGIADAKSVASAIRAQAATDAETIVAEARATLTKLGEEIVDKHKAGALIDAENAAKQADLDALNAKIAAAKAAIAGLAG